MSSFFLYNLRYSMAIVRVNLMIKSYLTRKHWQVLSNAPQEGILLHNPLGGPQGVTHFPATLRSVWSAEKPQSWAPSL